RKRGILCSWICCFQLQAAVQTYVHIRLHDWALWRSVTFLFIRIEPYVSLGRGLATVKHCDVFLVNPFTVVACFTLIKRIKLLLRDLEYHTIAIKVFVTHRPKICAAQTDTADLIEPASLDARYVCWKSVQGRRRSSCPGL